MMPHALELIWGLLWLGCGAALQVQIRPPHDLYVPIGNSMLFKCQVVGDASDIDWYNPLGEKILPSNTNIVVSRDDEFSSTLTISRVTEDHAGFFKCVAKAQGQEAEATARLLLYHDITFRNAPSPQVFIEGDNVSVICDVFSSPAPEVVWRKGQYLLKGATDERIKVLENGHLHIHNLQRADEGVYHCEGRIESFGILSSRMIRVVVSYAPKIQHQGAVYTWEGNPVNISCEVEAHPSAEMSWFKDGLQLLNTNNIKIYHMPTVSYLEVNPESLNDFGGYNCKATNILGVDSKEFLLLEAEVPSSPDIQQVEPFSSTAEVKFNKPASSGGAAILKYRIQWRLPDGEWNSTEFEASEDSTKITITKLYPETSFEVRMSAINGKGEGESSKPLSFKTKKVASEGWIRSSFCQLLSFISAPMCGSQ